MQANQKHCINFTRYEVSVLGFASVDFKFRLLAAGVNCSRQTNPGYKSGECGRD